MNVSTRRSGKYPLPHLLDLMHLINRSLLDYPRDASYMPTAQDFSTLQDIEKMAVQLKLVSYVVAIWLERRQNGEPEMEELVTEKGIVRLDKPTSQH